MIMANKGGYDVEFVCSEPNDVTCCICLFVLREPMQAEQCGHRFCKSCVEDLRNSGNQPLRCPEDRNEINVFQDRGKEREISKFRVSCPNKKNGCDWIEELLHLKNHLEECTCQLVKCSNAECEESLPRWQINSHMEQTCCHRKVACQHCTVSYLFIQEKMHFDVCQEIPVKCELCESVDVPRGQMEEHLLNQCPKRLHTCKFSDIGCTEKVSLEKLPSHESTAIEKHLVCALERIRQQDEKIDTLTVKMNALSDIVSSSKALNALKDKSTINFDNFQIRFEEAKNGKDGFVQRFFALDGYHCKIQVHLNGNDQTTHKHMSVMMSLEHGQFDDSLEWPMKANVSFSFQNERHVLTFSSVQDEIKHVFERPGSGKSAGFPLYISHDSINSFVINNILKVAVHVRPFLATKSCRVSRCRSDAWVYPNLDNTVSQN